MQLGKINPQGKISFPGFQEIGDFTATGSEASWSLAVDGDTDKEYRIIVRSIGDQYIQLRLNNDSGGNYGRQTLINDGGTIEANRAGGQTEFFICVRGLAEASLLTPTGFIKTFFCQDQYYTSGTTIRWCQMAGRSYNSTSNITSLNFLNSTGNFTSGTRITVYARRSQ